MTDIRQWLQGHGLDRYAETFAENDIGLDVVAQLSDDELRELGVSLGDRKRLATALRQLVEADTTPIETSRRSTSGSADAERRHLTVMFCDLVGSTALSDRLDPEDFRGIIASYQEAARRAIERYDGYIARYMGDGLLVYFGYPQAHEDDAERAVRAGLSIVSAVAALVHEPPVSLEVRVGIATGLVVAGDIVGEGASEERAVLGATPNLAARLQSIADPNRVVVSEDTHRLIEGLFSGDVLRELSLKGISKPVDAFRVEGESGVSRFEAAAARGLVPLVGRDSELGLLSARWQQAKAGEGQTFLLSGEAGVGKSRLVRALLDRIADEPHAHGVIAGSPYHTNSAFYPVLELLRRAFGVTSAEDPARAVEKLTRGVSDLGLDPRALVPVLASLLTLPPDAYPVPDVTPQVLRERTLETLSQLISSQAKAQPLLLFVEDAHWLDASTLDLLSLVIEASEASTILVLVTYRPEFEPPWMGHPNVTVHALNRLGRSHTAQLAREIGGDRTLPLELVEDIVAKTDGVPLFIEELTKAVLQSGLTEQAFSSNRPRGVPSGAVPASLQDSLMARLDQLAPVKQVAQFAAVLGRTFSRERMLAAGPFEEGTLDAALEQLVGSELVHRRGAEPNVRYEFKHALVRDAAYESLLKDIRQEYHARIARALEQGFPEVVEAAPEEIGRHYAEAGMPDEAIPHWSQAGKRALDGSALVEAIAQLETGIELIGQLPPGLERDRQELELQLLLASSYNQRGAQLEGARQANLRAKALADQVGDIEQRFQASFGVYTLYQHGGELDASLAIVDELLAVADQLDDPGLKLEACHAGWTSHFVAEKLSSVIDLTERGLALYDAEHYRSHRYRFNHDAGACAMTLNAIAKMVLGFPDQAKEMANRARALAKEIDHPNSIAMTVSFCTNVFRLRHEPAVVEAWIDEQLAFCERFGFSGQVPFGHIIRGWALSVQDLAEEGLPLILEGLETIRGFGIKTLSFQLCTLADAYCALGRHQEGLEVVDEALGVVETVNEHRWEPEIYRLQGEMLHATGDSSEAERVIRRGLDVAAKQGARWFELRAAVSLARLLSDGRRPDEAREILTPVYRWFTEGFDTRDLVRAKQLLASLD